MKKESNRILFVELLLFIISCLIFFLSKKFHMIFYSLILMIPLITNFILLGFKERKEVGYKDVLLNILIMVISYYLIIYILGYFIGFLKTSYNLSILSILSNVVPILIFIVVTELFRMTIVNKCKYNSKLYIVLLVIILSFVELVTKGTLSSINNNSDILKFIITFLSILSKNILLTYIVYYSSVVNSIAYRIIMEVPLYIIPIIPNFGNYLNSIISILFPVLVLFVIRKELITKRDKIVNSREDIKNRKIDKGITIIIVIVLIVIIVLVSGITRFYALTVGSNSMDDTISMGDIVIVDKNRDKYNENDIIAYKYKNKIIIHRIVNIEDNYCQTKGDNNESLDEWKVSYDDIVGVVCFKIKYLGWPTIKLNQWIMDGE